MAGFLFLKQRCSRCNKIYGCLSRKLAFNFGRGIRMASLFSYLTVGLTSHLFCHYNIGQIKREVRTKSPRGYTHRRISHPICRRKLARLPPRRTQPLSLPRRRRLFSPQPSAWRHICRNTWRRRRRRLRRIACQLPNHPSPLPSHRRI
nr:MAG TPA: hypothetical protein [Caudoviricetes sp.]